jgi:HSP20 family protein
MLNLQERMNRLFEEALSRGRADGAEIGTSPSWTPLADVYETSDTLVVQVELPGVDPSDIEIQVDGETLVLRGHKRLATETRPDCFHRMERSYGLFTRSFALSDEVDADRMTMEFRAGLLRVELPRLRARGSRTRPQRAD